MDGHELKAFACLDEDRLHRTGIPEVIYGEGKTAEQLKAIFLRLQQTKALAIATRVNPSKAAIVREAVPTAIYHEQARMLTWFAKPRLSASSAWAAVVTAGTSDLAVAEEAAVTLESFGCHAERVYDVGVAGLHRVLGRLDTLRKASAVIVVAGMDGALPSVVAGLVTAPVIAVPTSVGYGAAFQGIAPLLSMLNSCSPGLAVVNIDNGFGAACFTMKLLQQCKG